MRSKDTMFAGVKLPRCLVCRGVKVEWGRHQSRSSEVCCTRGTFDEGVRHNTARGTRAFGPLRPHTECPLGAARI